MSSSAHSWAHSELRIRTPEGITFAYTLAGPVSRAMAAAVDIFCIFALCLIAAQAFSWMALFDQDLFQALALLSYFVVSIGYGIILEWFFRGRTLGKRWLRLRVIDSSGMRLQFHQVFLRNVLRAVDLLPGFYLLGGVVSLLNSHHQRLGDLAAGTTVIFEPEQLEPDVDQLLVGKFNSFRDHPHLAARLRQSISPALARLSLQALVRRDDLESGARVALFGDLAAHLKSLASFPAEVTDSMGDEQYVRNVVDLLFRSSERHSPTSARSSRDSF